MSEMTEDLAELLQKLDGASDILLALSEHPEKSTAAALLLIGDAIGRVSQGLWDRLNPDGAA